MRYGLIPLLFALGCASAGNMAYTTPGHSNCSNGAGHDDDGNYALVCVNRDKAGNITANPQRVRVKATHDIFVLFSDETGEIDVQFSADTPIYRNHHTNGTAAARSRFKGTAHTPTNGVWKKYRIVDRESGKDEDPEVMIDPAPTP